MDDVPTDDDDDWKAELAGQIAEENNAEELNCMAWLLQDPEYAPLDEEVPDSTDTGKRAGANAEEVGEKDEAAAPASLSSQSKAVGVPLCRKRHNCKTTCKTHAPSTFFPPSEDVIDAHPHVGERRPKKPSELCRGLDGVDCTYNSQPHRIGEPARVHPDRGQERCVFCDPEHMASILHNSRGKGVVTIALRAFQDSHRLDIFEAALAKVPESERERIRAALRKPQRTKKLIEERRNARLEKESWETLLRNRVVITKATRERRQAYRQYVREDLQRLRSKFPALLRALKTQDDTWRSNIAVRFEAWCREDAWIMCKNCHRLEARALREVDITGKIGRKTHSVKHCKHCAYGTGYPTVELERDIPEVLRDLSEESLWAIVPLDIMNGTPTWASHGYRVHTDMTRFWWKPICVEDQIKELWENNLREHAEPAGLAFDYLMHSQDSSYKRFINLHSRFLAKNQDLLTGDAKKDWRVLQLPRACIEEVGIECALWPHLYPRTNMCETHVRSLDFRRESKPTRTVFDKRTMRARAKYLRERREATIDADAHHGKEYYLALQGKYEQMIRLGSKTIEGRLDKGIAAKINPGDTVVLGFTRCLVKHVYAYWSFAEMLQDCGLEKVLPGCPSVAQGTQIYYDFPGYQKGEAQYGVTAFDLEVLDKKRSRPSELNARAAEARKKITKARESKGNDRSEGSGDKRCRSVKKSSSKGENNNDKGSDDGRSSDSSSSSSEDKDDDDDDVDDHNEDKNDDGNSSEEGFEPLDFAKAHRNSAKASYLAKVLGPIAEYGANYDLFQFVYDLWLWSAVGSKKNKDIQCPLHLTMAQYAFSPEYWQTRHAALMDMVRQIGVPTLFVTIAPYEWSFPMHQWVTDEMHKQLRSQLHLPVAETLHIAHVLAQAVHGLMTGANKATTDGGHTGWRSHIFAAKDGSNKATVVNYFGRLEFQDGKRKRYVNMTEAARMFYHGRGTVHLHLLVWLENIEAIQLEESIKATSPSGNAPLRDLVEGSQRSYTGSGWPVQHEASWWDAKERCFRLQHLPEDHCTYSKNHVPQGVRAYIVDLLSSLFCHLDVLGADGRGALLAYVATYVPKFSDSFTNEWLNEAASGYEISRRILTDYHPLEPEMILQMCMQWFPQVFAGVLIFLA